MRDTVSVMSMTQLIFGAALGYIVAYAVLFGTRHSVAWLRRDGVQMRLRALASAPGPVIASGLVKYGAVIGASAALIALGAWAIGDYYAAKSVSSAATASVPDAPMAAPAPGPKSTEEVAVQAAPRQALPPAADATPDPYADRAFKVQRTAHRAGVPLSLTEKLLRRSEARARTELLAETQQHASRSQYDCEAADRAERYIKADLDVWGFAAWQLKYFPVEGYKGATLAQCRDIKSVVDPAELDLRSTVAQGHHS
jgi:hypothetical protein